VHFDSLVESHSYRCHYRCYHWHQSVAAAAPDVPAAPVVVADADAFAAVVAFAFDAGVAFVAAAFAAVAVGAFAAVVGAAFAAAHPLHYQRGQVQAQVAKKQLHPSTRLLRETF
jgi:hypothetical protein